MKKHEVHKVVVHKLVNFVFIYDLQAFKWLIKLEFFTLSYFLFYERKEKIQLFPRIACTLGKESVSLPNYSNF